MALLLLAPESLRHIAKFLQPSEAALQLSANSIFTDKEAHRRSRIWDNGRELPTRGLDDEVTARDVRSFCNVNRWLRSACREMIVSTIRIVCEETLEYLLSDPEAIEMVFDLRLTPTQFILPIAQQAELLSRIAPGQLRSLSLSLFPFLLANNLTAGFRPADDANFPVISAASKLEVKSLRILTNIAGIAPSLRLMRGIKFLEIFDEGLYDGGIPDAYEGILSEQYGILIALFANNAETLEHISFRQQHYETRPADYAFLDVCNILDTITLSGSKQLSNLTHLEINSVTAHSSLLADIFQCAPQLTTLEVFLRTPLILPPLPRMLQYLATNCHLPPDADAIPAGLQTLRVRRNGPLLPSPPDDYVPKLPSTLKCLHAYMAPGVDPDMVRQLFQHCPHLEDVELLALPLPWLDNCECGPAEATSRTMTYLEGFQKHQELDPNRLGWREGFDLSILSDMLVTMPNLRVFAFNHDHYTAHAAFPDARHLGLRRASEMAAQWYDEHSHDFCELARQIFEAVPQLNILRWRVCPSEFEAWMTFTRGTSGIDSTLEVGTSKI